MNTLIESLKKNTEIIVDYKDIDLIKKFCPKDVLINPSFILKNVLSKKHEHIVNISIMYARKKGGDIFKKIINVNNMIIVNIGCYILKYISGVISIEIDSKLSYNTDLCIKRVLKIISLYSKKGIDKSRILVTLVATWECIQASKYLQSIGINCNLTLLFSFAQARICAEASVFMISVFLGRIYDWYKYNNFMVEYFSKYDRGIFFLKNIFNYYKQYNYNTIITGKRFRRIEQILELSGCDKLIISPEFLKKLQLNIGEVPIKLNSKKIKKISLKPSKLSESEFRWFHNQDAMAVEKFSEGIRKFGINQKKLENFIESKI